MFNNNIRISIIIPCYNDGIYIIEAIQSAEQYKGNDAEIIIVNDGSTDDYTILVLRELESGGYFVINQDNIGLASARNNAIKVAKGNYILPLDSDNKIKPEYISKSIRILDENPEIGVVYSDLEYFGEEFSVQRISEFDFSKLMIGNYIDACAIYRKQVWIDVKGYDPNLNKLFWEDWEFWIHAYKKGWKFFHIQEVLFYYRKKKDSLALHALIPKERNKAYDYILFSKHSDVFFDQYKEIYHENASTNNIYLKKKIFEKDQTIHTLHNQIREIQRSITWKFMSKINNCAELLFPKSTKRRSGFDLCMIGINTLINDGLKTFWLRLMAYRNSTRTNIKIHECYFMKGEIQKRCNYKLIKKEIEHFKYKPIISIIMPTWNTPSEILEKAIESVIAQVYPYWELCIADGNSNSETKKVLDKYNKIESKIRLKLLDKNEGISANSNQAVSLATGEFIGLLDHDDELTFDALYEVARLLQEHPEADLIYSDEDKIDDQGNRSGFFFKPDWSPDLLFSQNYISHFGVYRKVLVDAIKGFRIGYEGSQDYDLVLRFTELTKNIFHISQILYHWRTTPNSLALNPNAKQYAYDSAIRSISDAMYRRNIPITDVEMNLYKGNYRISYEINENETVSIIVPTKDRLDLLEKCINSIIQKTEYNNYEILIINNQSEYDETVKYFNHIVDNPNINVIDYNKDFNYSAINNYAVNFVKGKYLLFLNNDTEIISNRWINSMIEYCQKDHVGAVGAKLLYPNNSVQHAGVFLSSNRLILHSHKHLPDNYPGYFSRPHIVHNISAVTGACLMIKKDHFIEIDGFDEINLGITYNDIDLCLKLLEKGYVNIYTPFAKLYHHESLSRGFKTTKQHQIERDFFIHKWKKIFDNDPYYNPNLTQSEEDYSLRY